MKTHISLNVRDVGTSVEYYQKVFGVDPQKQTVDYAKFDLNAPPLNLSLVYSPDAMSTVNHLGIEVESSSEITAWEENFLQQGLDYRIEQNIDCCFARQDKVWFKDPNGINWEIFTVLEQLPVDAPLANTGCCGSSPGQALSVAEGCS